VLYQIFVVATGIEQRVSKHRQAIKGSLGIDAFLRTDSASFLSERQRIVSFSAFRADSASPPLCRPRPLLAILP
jgi:hypothetical protein